MSSKRKQEETLDEDEAALGEVEEAEPAEEAARRGPVPSAAQRDARGVRAGQDFAVPGLE